MPTFLVLLYFLHSSLMGINPSITSPTLTLWTPKANMSWEIPVQLGARKTSSTQLRHKPSNHLTKRLLQFSERGRTWSNWKDLDLDAMAQWYCSGWDQREAEAALQEDSAASQDTH